MLDNIGWEYDYKPDIAVAEIKRILRGYDGLIVRSKTTVNRDLLGNSPTIRFVGRAGAGVDNVDVDYLKEKNIQIIHAAEGNRDPTKEAA